MQGLEGTTQKAWQSTAEKSSAEEADAFLPHFGYATVESSPWSNCLWCPEWCWFLLIKSPHLLKEVFFLQLLLHNPVKIDIILQIYDLFLHDKKSQHAKMVGFSLA